MPLKILFKFFKNDLVNSLLDISSVSSKFESQEMNPFIYPKFNSTRIHYSALPLQDRDLAMSKYLSVVIFLLWLKKKSFNS